MPTPLPFEHHVTLIAAMGLNRVIGYKNTMPWHLPSDLSFFKARTTGKVLIMGRNTFASVGRPLPGRTTIVVTRTQTAKDYPFENCHVASNLVDGLNLANQLSKDQQEIIVAGGGQIYAQALTYATRLVITQILKDFTGDTFFPEWNPQQWSLVSENTHTDDAIDYKIQEFHKILRD